MNIDERMSRLERESRRWRFLAVACLLIIGFWFSYTMLSRNSAVEANGDNSASIPEEIRTNRLLIVNNDGETVGTFQAGKSGTFLDLKNPNSQDRIVMQVTRGLPGATVMLSGENGYVTLKPETISLSRSNQRARALIQKLADGVTLSSEEKQFIQDKSTPSVQIRAADSEGGIIDVYNPAGKRVVSIESLTTNNGAVIVRDARGRTKQFLHGN